MHLYDKEDLGLPKTMAESGKGSGDHNIWEPQTHKNRRAGLWDQAKGPSGTASCFPEYPPSCLRDSHEDRTAQVFPSSAPLQQVIGEI